MELFPILNKKKKKKKTILTPPQGFSQIWMWTVLRWPLTPTQLQSIVKASLHYGPQIRTVEEGLILWFGFMVRLLKKLVMKALGPELGVNQIGPRRMHQKVNVRIFFNTCPKGVVLKKKSSLIILLSSLLIKWVVDVVGFKVQLEH